MTPRERLRIGSVGGALGCVIGCVMVFVVMRNAQETGAIVEERARKFESYCGMVRESMHDDWLAFQDPKQQEIALGRFRESRISGHTARDILRCAARDPIDDTRFMLCWLNKDYACLAGFARTAKEAIDAELAREK